MSSLLNGRITFYLHFHTITLIQWVQKSTGQNQNKDLKFQFQFLYEINSAKLFIHYWWLLYILKYIWVPMHTKQSHSSSASYCQILMQKWQKNNVLWAYSQTLVSTKMLFLHPRNYIFRFKKLQKMVITPILKFL